MRYDVMRNEIFFGIFCQRSTRKKSMDWSVTSTRKKSEKTDRSVTSRQSEVLKSSTWEVNISLKRWRLENGRVCKYLSDQRRKWDQRYFERFDQVQGFVEGPSSRLYREGDDEENFGKDKNRNGCERSVNPVIYSNHCVMIHPQNVV